VDFEVSWSPEATDDLKSIAEYISRDSEFYARAVVTEILKVAQSVGSFPLIGRIVPEIEDEAIRERFVYSYRLVYRVEKDSILILAVIHGKRLVDVSFDEGKQ
jgi:toxin ParE1/3/4